ncbi:Glutaredoxin [Carpediemonas membranifera]|uniref:Glutaredoxin n=1 Tax=Carpediemonas membranifera TaxID=201153 RepID=A0A8J6E331_9EUKA|nr:Glutaredoxin [Carpediemonas membranifera]|eukprot:KAG9395081.1 Glutaredoxin [Carpediemonas membranifera]
MKSGRILTGLFLCTLLISVAALSIDIEQTISENEVVLFTKSYCGFCRMARNLLDNKGIAYKVIELDQVSDGRAIQSELAAMTGHGTVPVVFIAGEFIGGSSELHALEKSGGLVVGRQ